MSWMGMSWMEWGIALLGLGLGWGVVSMLMSKPQPPAAVSPPAAPPPPAPSFEGPAQAPPAFGSAPDATTGAVAPPALQHPPSDHTRSPGSTR